MSSQIVNIENSRSTGTSFLTIYKIASPEDCAQAIRILSVWNELAFTKTDIVSNNSYLKNKLLDSQSVGGLLEITLDRMIPPTPQNASAECYYSLDSRGILQSMMSLCLHPEEVKILELLTNPENIIPSPDTQTEVVKGAGRALILHAFEIAIAKGKKGVSLASTNSGEEFYKNLGFEAMRIGPLRTGPSMRISAEKILKLYPHISYFLRFNQNLEACEAKQGKCYFCHA
jgi:hypothetical protein